MTEAGVTVVAEESYRNGVILHHSDGTYTPMCLFCHYTGKVRERRGDARGAVTQHEAGNPHRQAMARRAARRAWQPRGQQILPTGRERASG